MRMRNWMLGLLAVLPCVPTVFAQHGGDYGGALIVCESYDSRDNYCPANTRDGVRLLRQVSRAACMKGQSWGYDRRGIWVSDGCRAEFEVGGGFASGDGSGAPYRGNESGAPFRGGRPGYDDDDHGRFGDDDRRPAYGGGGGNLVLCESRDFRYTHCPVRIGRSVSLVRQHSRSECRFDRSWGWDRGGIWVDQGCAAEFAVD